MRNDPPGTRESEEGTGFEAMLGELSARFVNVPADRVDREIEDAQRRVCECLGFDLSALWQRTPESPGHLVLTHLYRPPGGPPVPERMDASEHFPWSQQQVAAGKTIVVSSMDHVPEEASRDVASWRRFGMRTAWTIPLSAGDGPLFGTVSFNDTSGSSAKCRETALNETRIRRNTRRRGHCGRRGATDGRCRKTQRAHPAGNGNGLRDDREGDGHAEKERENDGDSRAHGRGAGCNGDPSGHGVCRRDCG